MWGPDPATGINRRPTSVRRPADGYGGRNATVFRMTDSGEAMERLDVANLIESGDRLQFWMDDYAHQVGRLLDVIPSLPSPQREELADVGIQLARLAKEIDPITASIARHGPLRDA
jgi:hypothetical protein